MSDDEPVYTVTCVESVRVGSKGYSFFDRERAEAWARHMDEAWGCGPHRVEVAE